MSRSGGKLRRIANVGTNEVARATEEHIRAEEQLKRARDDALAANRAKDDLLATLSHELRPPLNPVLLLASEAARDPTVPEAFRADFKMIADSVSLQARLIDDLPDLNRITHGKIALEFSPLDLHAVLRDASATIRETIEAKEISLTFDLQATTSIVRGDPVRLRQGFWNIIKNAIKFTPRAPGRARDRPWSSACPGRALPAAAFLLRGRPSPPTGRERTRPLHRFPHRACCRSRTTKPRGRRSRACCSAGVIM